MIPFSPPRLDGDTVQEVTETLLSGWITTGPRTKRFEKEITAYTGARSTLCLNSCTAGMELVLRWFGVGPGDEVILPAYTYCATANVVIHCGATPVMVDCRPGEFNIDPEGVRNAITERTKVVMSVDIGGFPADYDALNEVLNDREVQSRFHPKSDAQKKLGRILVLADAAHSFGAVYRGTRVGKVADVTAFSFHAVKNLTTAEGGAVCLNLPPDFDTDEIYAQLNVMSLHGQSKDALAKMKSGGWKYDVLFPGFKCNMTDIQAAIGLVELSRYDSQTLPKRRELSARYNQGFADREWALLPPTDDGAGTVSAFHLYPLRLKGVDEDKRDRIIQAMTDKQVAVNVHFIPLPMLTAYRNRGFLISDYPEAYDAYRGEISLPLFYDMTFEQVDFVVKTLVDIVENTAY